MSNPGSFGDPGVNPYAGAGGGTAVRNATVNLNATSGNYQQQMSQAATATNQLNQSVGGLLTRIDNLFKSGGRSLKIVGAADVASLAGATASAASLQAQMSTLGATAAINRTSMSAYGKAVDSVFSNFPSHQGDVVALITQITNLGAKKSDVQSLATTFEKLGAASGENIPQLTDSLISLSRQMGTTNAQQINGYANAVLTVAKNAGVGVTSVLNFSQSIAPIARQAGIGEAAVLGISTAFTKAGADGFVAANTFNSIVNDITTLTRTGSPQLAKYASFIGQTVAQFKQMPAKDQITGIFDAIAKGGPQALNFVNELGLGTRALSAVQAVAQSGGIGQFINTAQANSTNGKNLDRGSAAALNTLDSQWAIVKNQVTKFADLLGAPLLKPLTMLAEGLSSMLNIVNKVVASLGPIPTMLASLVGVLAPIAGLMLGHAGLVAGISAVRMFTNTGTRQVFSDARTAAASGDPEAVAAQRASMVGMPWQARMAGRAGGMVGGTFGAASAAEEGVAGASMARLGMFGAIRGVGAASQGYFTSTTRMLNDSGLKGLARSAYQTDGPGVGQRLRGFTSTVSANAEGSTVIRAITTEGMGLAKAIAGVGVATVRAGASIAAAGVGKLTGLGGVAGAAEGAISTRGLLSRAGSAMFSMPGMLALGVGVPALTGLYHSYTGKQAASSETDVISSLNPLQQYNNALGLATGKLADFSNNVTKASTAAAGQSSTAASWAQAQKLGPNEAAQFGGTGSSDPTLAALAKHSKGNTAQAAALLASYRLTDPKQLDAFGQNMLAAGYTRDQTQAVIGGFTPGAGPDYTQIGKSINATEGHHGFFTSADNASKTGNKLIAAALTGVSTQKADDLDTHSAAYAQTNYLSNSLKLLAGQASGAKGNAGAKALANTFATLTGGSQKEYSNRLLADFPANFSKLSPAAQQAQLMNILATTPDGKKYLANIAQGGGTTDPSKIAATLAATSGQLSAAATTYSGQYGSLGKFINSNADVQNALGGQSGDPATQQKATEGLVTSSYAATGNFTKTASALQALSDSMGGASTTAGALFAQAAAWARQLQGYKAPYQSRAQNLTDAANTVVASHAAAIAPGASAESKAQYATDSQAYEQSKASYNQYLISLEQAANQFGVSQERAQEDYQTSIYRSQRNFQIQMVQGEQDYLKQRSRSIQDFNIQMARQAQSAAESIYSPFQRVQSQSVMNGGMLAGNLTDENNRIQQQLAQLNQLKKEGLSQGAIDTLKLSDPSNAQQVNSIAQSVANDPATIKKINALIAVRQQSTVALTQSQYNEDFRNTVADFTKGLDRTQQDYATARQRAVDAQALSLQDQAADFQKMTTRSAQDLTTQMTELYGNFADNYTTTLASINSGIAKYAPAIAQDLIAQVNAAKAAIDNATGAGADNSGGGGGGGAAAPAGSSTNPIYRAGVLGINSQGQVGTYSPSGTFTPGSANQAEGGKAGLAYIGNPKDASHGSAQDPAGAKKYAATQLAKFGWGQDQMAPLINLWNNESGWRWSAYNNTSGATGIPQALPGEKMATSGADWKTNGATQIDWGLGYIKGRYGSPAQANAFEFSHSPAWYAAGGIFTGPSVIGLGEAGAEAALPLNSRGAPFMVNFYDEVSKRMAARMATGGMGMPGSGTGGTTYHSVHEDHRTFYNGPLQIISDDPATMERKLAERAKLKRLAQPARASGG